MLILTFDHTQRSSWQMCKRSYLFRHLCGIRKATPDAPGFSYGAAFHAASEVIDITGDIECAMTTFAETWNVIDEKIRTLGRAREILLAYRKYVEQKGWKFLQTSEKTMEVAFNEPLTTRINYAGRCDRQFDNEDIGEWKTSYYLYNSSGNPMPYLQQWWGHNSIRGYAWARKAPRVHLLGIGVYPQRQGRGGDLYPGIESLAIPIQEWEMKQFIHEATMVGEEIISCAQKNGLALGEQFEENLELMLSCDLWEGFPTNTSSCYFNRNNPCQFIDLCTRNVPRGLVKTMYMLDPFLPWLLDTKEFENKDRATKS